MATIQVAINECGRRIGHDHHNAKLTNGDVQRILAMHDEGYGYRRLSVMFDISKSQVRNIVLGRKRSQYAVSFRLVTIND